MKKGFRKFLVIMLSAIVALGMGTAAFAYTSMDDDGNRDKANDTSMNVVYCTTGMLRIMDEGSSVTLSEDKTKLNVVAKTSESKTWGAITKLALIEQTATDADKDAAASEVKFENADYSAEATSRTLSFSIPVADAGKKIPVCRYVSTSATEGQWSNFSEQHYFIVVKAPVTVTKETGLMMKLGNEGSIAFNGTKEEPHEVSYALTLKMENSNYDQVRVSGEETAITLNENNEFVNIPIEKKGVTELEFHSTGSGKWFPRDLSFDKDSLSVYVEDHKVRVKELNGMTFDETVAYAKNNATPEFVDTMIAAVQVQYRTEDTDRYCAAANAAWNALTKDQKEEVEEGDYFAVDTGDASKDDPRNQDEIGTKELLVVSFGTSFNESRAEDIGGVENALAKAYPDWSVRRAFTAQIIINHVQARDSEKIDNMEQALDRAVANGVKELVVQPTHLMHGAEYDEMKAAIDAVRDKFTSVKIAEPLMGPVGEKTTDLNSDKEAAAKAMVAEAVAKAGASSLEELDTAKTAIVFMGHGTGHGAAITYSQMQNQMKALDYKNVFVGTVEGNPAETALPEVKKAVENAGYTKVILRPMMVVAGDHANNDMADPDRESGSWFAGFSYGGEVEVEGQDQPVDIGAGFGPANVTCQVEGLGRIPAIQQMYVDHTGAEINPADQTLTVKANNKTYTVKKLKKKAITFKAVTVKGAKTKVTYTGKATNAKSKKALKFNAKKGKITVKKGTKKGTYKMKITVKAAATAEYNAATATKTVSVKVK